MVNGKDDRLTAIKNVMVLRFRFCIVGTFINKNNENKLSFNTFATKIIKYSANNLF